MLTLLGYLLVILGIVMVVFGVLAWLGIVTPHTRILGGGPWDFLTELTKRAPWIVVVGLILIYLGLKVLGVSLSP
jgi:uncharacterized membrane protein